MGITYTPCHSLIFDDQTAGGTIHCSHDYWAHNVRFMLDWLEERL